MPRTIRGRVLFANSVPASGVRVRVFDKDSGPDNDDDLTITAGLSNSEGNFEVVYEPGNFRDAATIVHTTPRNPPYDWTLERHESRRVDWSDLFLPYLRFDYTFQSQARTWVTTPNWFSTQYMLPQVYSTSPFLPSQNGYKFINLFKGVALPFSIPEIPGLLRISGHYGLCGGMTSSAYDHYLFDKPLPQNVAIPRSGSVLQRHLYRRQMDTFGTLGEYILKFASWMKLPDDTADGLCSLTMHEFTQFRKRMDDNLSSVLGVLYAKGTKISHLFLNHQVLGYALETQDADHYAIRIYDPNYPERDDVRIKVERRKLAHEGAQPVYGLFCEQWLGNQRLCAIHGFFLMPYVPVKPPANLG